MVFRGIILLLLAAVYLSKNSDAQNVRRTLECASGMRKTDYFQVGVAQGECASCGESCCKKSSMGKRIYEGNDVKKGEFPWSVALFSRSRKHARRTRWTFLCGGVLIRHNKVATAAHCVKQFVNQQSLMQVRVSIGERHIQINNDGSRKINHLAALKHVVEAWIPNDFNKMVYKDETMVTDMSYKNDLAILTINGTTKRTPHICLRTKGERYMKQVCWGIGHGYGMKNGRYLPRVRRKLNKSPITLDTNNTCLPAPHIADDTMLCASHNDRNVNCKMDSGSPVVCRVEPDNPCSAYYLAGIFSAHEQSRNCGGGFTVLSNLISTRGDSLVTKIPDIYLFGFGECCSTKRHDEW